MIAHAIAATLACMASVFAIVSKAVFEQLAKAAGGAEVGTVLPLDRYASTHKSLTPLGEGGSLFLVTVRPPDEALWLVAILASPALDDEGWSAEANTTAIVDISKEKKLIEFASGTGIHAKPGALGMSLQTPRALTEAGVARLLAAAGATPATSQAKSAPAKSAKSAPAKSAKSAPAKSAKSAPAKSAKSAPAKSAKSKSATSTPAAAISRSAKSNAATSASSKSKAATSAKSAKSTSAAATSRSAKSNAAASASTPATSAKSKSAKSKAAKPAKSAKSSSASGPTAKSAKSSSASGATAKSAKSSSASGGTAKSSSAPGATAKSAKSSSTSGATAKSAKSSSTSGATAKSAKSSSAAEPDGASLDALTAAIDGGSASAALEAALGVWRATRDDAIADLVDTLASKLEGPVIEDERAWSIVAASKRAADVNRLLDAIGKLPVSFLPQVGARLVELPADPRIAMATSAWALDPPTTSSSTYPFWTKVLDALGKSGDRRALANVAKRLRMKQGDSDFWPKFYKALGKARDAIGTVPVAPVDSRALGKLAKAAGKLATEAIADAGGGGSRAARIEGHDYVLRGTPLENAVTQFRAGLLDAGIGQLVDAWRQSRAPEIANVIDRASRLSPWHGAPLGVTAKEIDEAWRDAWSTDPIGRLPQLLPALNFGGAAMAEERLALLSTLVGDDPRISLKLAEACSFMEDRVSPERTQYWKSLFELLARHRDVRVCAPMRADFRDFQSNYYNHHRQGKRIVGDFVLHPEQAFGGALPTLDVAGRKQLATVEKALAAIEAKRDRRERDLLSAIADDWKSDEPRLVYADWLTEQQDPRGERIVLACKPSRTKAEDKRLKELQTSPSTSGALREVGPITWDRGIPSSVEISWGTSTLTLRALAGEPVATLLETITFHETRHFLPEAADLAAVIAHPDMLRLARVSDVPDELRADTATLAKPFVAKGKDLVRTR